MSGFRFSPRANRAHEVQWHPWGTEAFERASREGKPLLLAISGVWCHWCHVMDETSYSDPGIIDTLNSSYIPVRVDTDMRPDVNARYNLGGWPTTAILDSRGRVISGGTYIPPEAMLPWLKKAAKAYSRFRGSPETERMPLLSPAVAATEPNKVKMEEAYEVVLRSVHDSYDDKYHGFGREPKFPMTWALELCLDSRLARGDERSGEILLNTLEAMASGGMYDHVEGGFFRYSTTRDWSVPHFEKMLDDNAALLGLICRASRLPGGEGMVKTARHCIEYLTANLRVPGKGWAGTQDADEEYYRRDREARTSMNAPFIDRTIYVNWNGHMAKALLDASWALGDQTLEGLAVETLENLVRNAWSKRKGLAHYVNGSPGLWGRLEDLAWMGWALSRAFQTTGREDLLATSRSMADFALERLKAPEGGFYDTVPDPDAPGALSEPQWSLEENALAGRWLAELGALTREETYIRAARGVAGPGLTCIDGYGSHAAPFALLSADLFREWTVVEIWNDGSRALLDTALSSPLTQKVALPHPQAGGRPRASVCRGKTCLTPTEDPESLAGLLAGELPEMPPSPPSSLRHHPFRKPGA